MIAIAVVTIIPALLALIYIGSSTVFELVVSLSTSGLYASYFIPCSLLLWRRTTGQIHPHSPDSNDRENSLQVIDGADQTIDDPTVVQPQLAWGPWCIPGLLGCINNVYACVYILFVLFWSFWPPATPTTTKNMNYSILMSGVVIVFSIVYYHVWGKNQYLGPLMEREVRGFVVKGT
jgi:choline transport protein